MDNAIEETILYSQEQTKALALYLQQLNTREIADRIKVGQRTVQIWINKFKWKQLRDDSPTELAIRQRIAYLLWQDPKSDSQMRELDMLLKHNLGDPQKKNNKAKDGSNRGRPSNKVKNDVSSITKEMLDEYREKTFFEYQKQAWRVKNNPLLSWVRFYLKSRQIGLTYYFAYEAFEDAVLTGDNQIFISASKKQSEIFKNYIKDFAMELGGIELKGKDEYQLGNGATLYFLSTNSRTSQGYHGHLYVDEVFWINKFAELDDLAGGMSIHEKWRTTYLSTPSSVAHEAYPKWSGTKEQNIDISHKALKKGAMGIDGIYRQIITVKDAIAGGANFFNMKKIEMRYPIKEVFDSLFMCKFRDDSKAAFALKELMACKVDTDKWKDVDLESKRPVGNTPVWIGYDPSGMQDEAAIIVAIPPTTLKGKFRLIEKIRLKGVVYEDQADEIKALTEKYNVTEIAIDVTGIGGPVCKLVEKFFPRVTPIIYSINTKSNMVYKAKQIFNDARVEFDAAWDDLVHAFLMIKRVVTPKSNQVTFAATRTKENSHADLAMAAMHLFSLEPMDSSFETKSTVKVI
ncbi:terminase large subunit domain-containing protein [Hydrogenovibrio marinus]|uniref:Terminase n=2 Tax=Hydrogenovibrio marinus TaxID=28885 RepID=A0A066ZM15_HYDMR|nr:terminase family protein [Hydrogenovibrio marinus]KDN94853.1 terminase [Hydrogenovibrio marinus]BBN59313.1 terminase [Hydrogenovibrio marinus]